MAPSLISNRVIISEKKKMFYLAFYNKKVSIYKQIKKDMFI